jgi:ABC-type branched-subunit amino acid transport system substrate-binding protein
MSSINWEARSRSRLRAVRRASLATLLCACAVVGLTACGDSSSDSGTKASAGSSSTAASCDGAPIKLMTITTLTSGAQPSPEIAAGAKAAAAAVNKTCKLGRPIEITSCDDRFDPNRSAACGRQAVSDDVLAVVAPYSCCSDSFIPILEKAGIPAIGGVQSGAAEGTSKISFPMLSGIGTTLAQVTDVASLGGKRLAYAYLDLPGLQTIAGVVKQQAKELGVTFVAGVPVPATATDMAQYAAQATTSDVDAIMLALGPQGVAGFLKALAQQGTDIQRELIVIAGANASPPSAIKSYGSAANGLVLSGGAWPASDTSNPGIKQYLEELRAADQPTDAVSDVGVYGWSFTHLIADLLAKGEVSSAALIKQLTTAGLIKRPELAPIDFGSNPLAGSGDSPFATLRYFERGQVVSHVVNGTLTPLSDGFVSELTPAKLTRP